MHRAALPTRPAPTPNRTALPAAWPPVVFAEGSYQAAPAEAPVLRRAPEDGGGIVGEVRARLEAILAKPGPAPLYSHRGCPETFCKPFADRAEAQADLDEVSPYVLLGIGREMGWDPTVTDLWGLYLLGGATEPVDVSATLADAFTGARSTAYTTRVLLGLLRTDLAANARAHRPLDEDLPRFTEGQAAIGAPGHAHALWYDKADGIAGNIAGGVGHEQAAHPIGARPSTMNDTREVALSLDLRPNADGSTTVTPGFVFTLADTIDFCPGQCGTGDADVMLATTLLSRFEATGLAGDVPFVVRFPAPAELMTPFVVGGPADPRYGPVPTP